MKGDFTRSTFRPERHYRGVRMQQGRVQLDADWNEELDILSHLDDTTHADVIGPCGVPKDGGGFEVAAAADGTDLAISPGRIYVDGILCELESSAVAAIDVNAASAEVEALVADGLEFRAHQWIQIADSAVPGPGHLVRITDVDPVGRTLSFAPSLDAQTVGDLTASDAAPVVRRVASYTTQPDLPVPPLADPGDETVPPTLQVPDGRYLAYLDVWERHLTALDDDLIRDPALGGPDTATRVRIVWQVRLTAVDDSVDRCDAVPDITSLLDAGTGPEDRRRSTGRLRARAQEPTTPPEPCIVPATAGYRSLENQLYRVEIHRSGQLGTATFKWSRENGSVVTRWTGQSANRLTVSSVGRDAILGFASSHLVELLDDTRELHGEPGTLATLVAPPEDHTLIIDPAVAVDRGDFPGNPKVRRWDAPTEMDVKVPTTSDGWIALENGAEVRFEDGFYNTGDFWLIPARTTLGDVVWPTDPDGTALARPPDGIVHHYCPLALIEVTGGVPSVLEDCRDTFPTLTGICAEDVCFDNSKCQLVDVETVQDALDVLCEESTLRHHKKHLHGWGIVCGLQVVCGPDGEQEGEGDGPPRRAKVTVREGYAIDCEGNDILIAKDGELDVLKMLDVLQQEDPDRPILSQEGDGEVCLTLDLDPDRLQHRFGLERYDPNWDKPQSILGGTLLMDFYRDCILELQVFLRDRLAPKEDQGAGPGSEHQTVLANLLAHVINPQPGQNIFVSKDEHKLLNTFYTELRERLQSKTFCAMFDDARPFPDYPDELPEMDTIFGRGHHVRLRLRPGKKGSPEAYTVGPGTNPLKPSTRINRYDLAERKLVSQTDPIAGAATDPGATDSGSGGVQDVAFSPDGKRIYMIAPTRDGKHTFFRAGNIEESDVSWGPLVTLCDVRLATLATTPADKDNVYAVGLGTGLYRINPDAPDPTMPALASFTASGHLRITTDGRAVVTAVPAGSGPPTYTELHAYQVADGSQIFTASLEAAGQDDIAVFEKAQGAQTETVFVVAGLDGEGPKELMAFDLAGERLWFSASLEDTTIRLEPYEPTGMLIVTSEDGYALSMVDMAAFSVVEGYLLPLQVGPISIGSDPPGKMAYALNYVSNTITVIPGALLQPTFAFPFAALAAYRKAALEAFVDLMAGFLQYLKDCLCDHFLVQCPECSDEEKIYLGCVSIRAGNVYQVCNFSRRRYVKSFPTVGYWMSIIPIMPLLDRLIERFCCLVLPEIFGRYSVAAFSDEFLPGTGARVKVSPIRGGVTRFQATDVGSRAGEVRDRTRLASGAALAGLVTRIPEQPLDPSLRIRNIVNLPADEVETRLSERGLDVRRAPPELLGVSGFLDSLLDVFRPPAPGAPVTVHEQEGTVRFVSSARPAPSKALEGQVATLSRALEERDAALEQLRGRLEKVEARRPRAPSPQRVARLEAELEELRAFREEVSEFMKGRRPRPRSKR